MESNSINNRAYISGNASAECTLLITDIFNLFPGSFQKLTPLLEKRHRVITYNDNGFDIFNRTKQLRHRCIEGYADDLIISLQEKKFRSITYIAHSVNAIVAIYAACKEPQLFEKIILLSGLPHFRQNAKTQYQCGFDAGIETSDLFETITGYNELNEDTDQLPCLLATAFSKMDKEKAKLIFDLILSADCRNLLTKLTTPVMILQGVNDKIATNEAAFFMHRQIPESFIVKVRAKGHLPQLQAPEEIFKAIEIFMHPIVC